MSILWQARFFTTVNHLRNLPDLHVPEIAFAGRSNAGKSTAINTLCNQKKLAFASKTPGRTQHINYFSIGGAHVAQHRKDPTIVEEIRADAEKFGDKRRSPIIEREADAETQVIRFWLARPARTYCSRAL